MPFAVLGNSHGMRNATCFVTMKNQDGSLGARATQSELADCYGSAVARQLATIAAVHAMHWDWFQASIKEQTMIAAHHGRRALRQPGRAINRAGF